MLSVTGKLLFLALTIAHAEDDERTVDGTSQARKAASLLQTTPAKLRTNTTKQFQEMMSCKMRCDMMKNAQSSDGASCEEYCIGDCECLQEWPERCKLLSCSSCSQCDDLCTDASCGSGKVCVAGVCQIPTSTTSGSSTSVDSSDANDGSSTSVIPGTGKSCASTQSCEMGLWCINGKCKTLGDHFDTDPNGPNAECDGTKPCESGQFCLDLDCKDPEDGWRKIDLAEGSSVEAGKDQVTVGVPDESIFEKGDSIIIGHYTGTISDINVVSSYSSTYTQDSESVQVTMSKVKLTLDETLTEDATKAAADGVPIFLKK